MASNRKFKRLVRAHAKNTGMPYSAARQYLLARSTRENNVQADRYDLEELLRAAYNHAIRAEHGWVGIEHVLLELAGSSTRIAGLKSKIEQEISRRDPAETRQESVQATDQFVRLAQLLTFQKQFVPGGQQLTAPKVIDAIVQDNPEWPLAAALSGS